MPEKLKPAPRRVHCTRVANEYNIRLGRTRLPPLTEEEAGMLLHELLLLLPEVPREAAAQWQRNGRHPTTLIIRYYKAVDGDIRPSYERVVEDYAGAQKVISTRTCCLRHAVDGQLNGECTEDDPHAVLPVRDDAPSREAAEREATVQLARQYCEERGITMKQLMAEMRSEVWDE